MSALAGIACPEPFEVERVRGEFPILRQKVRGKPLVYLDSAATAHKPQAVVDAAACTGCQLSTRQFECPALVFDPLTKKVTVDVMICSGCAVCLEVCPARAITVREEEP